MRQTHITKSGIIILFLLIFFLIMCDWNYEGQYYHFKVKNGVRGTVTIPEIMEGYGYNISLTECIGENCHFQLSDPEKNRNTEGVLGKTKTITYQFGNVPAGSYFINAWVFHDENLIFISDMYGTYCHNPATPIVIIPETGFVQVNFSIYPAEDDCSFSEDNYTIVETYNSPDNIPGDMDYNGALYLMGCSTNNIYVISKNTGASWMFNPSVSIQVNTLTRYLFFYNSSLYASTAIDTGISAFDSATGSFLQAYTKESSSCSAGVFWGGNIWTTNGINNEINKRDTADPTFMVIQQTIYPDIISARGITVASDNYFYIIDGNNKSINKIDSLNFEVVKTWRLSSPITDPWGITYDGIFFWISDDGSDKIYKLFLHP